MKLTCFLFFLMLSFVQYLSAQQFNRPVPDGLFEYEFVDNGMTGNGCFLATPNKLDPAVAVGAFVPPSPVMFDTDGYIYWYAQPGSNRVLDFKYFESENKYSYTYTEQGNTSFLILDEFLNPIDTLNVIGEKEDVHEFQSASNGNWLLATIYYDTVDLSMYTFDGSQGDVNTILKGFGYQEFDNAGNLINQWNSNDHIAPTETYDYYGYNPGSFDYCHGNAIEEDVDGNLLISFRHLNSVYKIDRVTGAVIWKLGGNSSDFTFTNDAGFSAQHDIRVLDNGNYSVFDNASMALSQESRGVEYELNLTNWTATLISEYVHMPSFHSRAMGNYQTLSNDYKVLGYGRVYRPYPTAVVIDENQSELAAFYFEDSVVSYRFHYFDIPALSRPEISCLKTIDGFELTAITGTPPYLWSTGESTQTIFVDQIGSYQVWTTQGMGYVGSEPYFLLDLNDECSSIGLEETSLNIDEEYMLYNLMGQEIINPVRNQLYIRVSSSGLVEKVFFTE